MSSSNVQMRICLYSSYFVSHQCTPIPQVRYLRYTRQVLDIYFMLIFHFLISIPHFRFNPMKQKLIPIILLHSLFSLCGRWYPPVTQMRNLICIVSHCMFSRCDYRSILKGIGEVRSKTRREQVALCQLDSKKPPPQSSKDKEERLMIPCMKGNSVPFPLFAHERFEFQSF